MTTGFPLQLLGVALDGVSGRFFADDRHDLRFCHSGLKLGESVVHLAANAEKNGGRY